MAYGTAITPVASTRAGVTLPDATAGALQMSFTNTQKEVLIVKNASASPINVTIKIPVTVDGKAVASLVVAVANGTTKVIGPFPKAVYNDTDGMVHFDLSAITTVSVGVLQIGSAAY